MITVTYVAFVRRFDQICSVTSKSVMKLKEGRQANVLKLRLLLYKTPEANNAKWRLSCVRIKKFSVFDKITHFTS